MGPGRPKTGPGWEGGMDFSEAAPFHFGGPGGTHVHLLLDELLALPQCTLYDRLSRIEMGMAQMQLDLSHVQQFQLRLASTHQALHPRRCPHIQYHCPLWLIFNKKLFFYIFL